MPNQDDKGEKPTEQERDAAFAPHHSAQQQPDGDPGKTAKEDGPGTGESEADENDAGEAAGDRGQWNKS